MQPIQETANATEIAKSLSGKEKLQEGIFRESAEEMRQES